MAGWRSPSRRAVSSRPSATSPEILILRSSPAELLLLSRLAPDDAPGAADQPRELPEAAADAVGDEIDHAMLEHQHQLAPPAAEIGRRQHAGARRRDEVGNPKRGAEHAGALEHGRR